MARLGLVEAPRRFHESIVLVLVACRCYFGGGGVEVFVSSTPFEFVLHGGGTVFMLPTCLSLIHEQLDDAADRIPFFTVHQVRVSRRLIRLFNVSSYSTPPTDLDASNPKRVSNSADVHLLRRPDPEHHSAYGFVGQAGLSCQGRR